MRRGPRRGKGVFQRGRGAMIKLLLLAAALIVVDGHTVKMTSGERICLHGLDAPELSQSGRTLFQVVWMHTARARPPFRLLG